LLFIYSNCKETFQTIFNVCKKPAGVRKYLCGSVEVCGPCVCVWEF